MSTWTLSELIGLLQEAFAGFLGVDRAEVNPNRSIRELGMDSLTAMELMIDIEERLGVSLFINDFTGRETISELATAFVRERAS